MLDRVFAFLYRQRIKALESIPGPVPRFPIGTMGDFIGRSIWEVCAEYGQEYGGVSLAWFTGIPAVILNDPDSIGQVLDTDTQSYYKDAPTDAVAPVISPGDMFIANGERWQFLRRSSPVRPEVDSDWLSAQFPETCTVVRSSVERLVGNTFENLIEPIRELVFETISKAVWGRTFHVDVYADFLKLARMGNWRMSEPPPLQKLPPLDPTFYMARERWTTVFRSEADRASIDPGKADNNDLLHRTIRKGTPLSLEQLAEMLSSSVFFGGVFSTASIIAYTLRFLSEDVESLAGIMQELREREPWGERFDISALGSCTQLDFAIRESLRLSPPVPLMARNVSQERPATLGGHTLPANTFIVITNWLLHHDPNRWTDPEKFLPSRWAHGGIERDPYGSGYFFPFGRGPRACVGQNFALLLAKITLAIMLSRVKVDLDISKKTDSDYFFAVRHPKNLKARFVPI